MGQWGNGVMHGPQLHSPRQFRSGDGSKHLQAPDEDLSECRRGVAHRPIRLSSDYRKWVWPRLTHGFPWTLSAKLFSSAIWKGEDLVAPQRPLGALGKTVNQLQFLRARVGYSGDLKPTRAQHLSPRDLHAPSLAQQRPELQLDSAADNMEAPDTPGRKPISARACDQCRGSKIKVGRKQSVAMALCHILPGLGFVLMLTHNPTPVRCRRGGCTGMFPLSKAWHTLHL
jgi:hypothetical protein